MKSGTKTRRQWYFLRTVFTVWLGYQLLQSFYPPKIENIADASVKTLELPNLIENLAHYAGQLIILDTVKVGQPWYLYIGGGYYVESLDGRSRMLVLAKQYPPTEGTVINILGLVKPVASFRNLKWAYIKEAQRKEIPKV